MALLIAATTTAVFMAGPIVVLAGRAMLDGSLDRALGTAGVAESLRLSLATTAVSLAAVILLGLPLAVVLAGRRFRGQGLVEAIVDLPIVLPPSVAGLALLLVLGRRGLVGETLEALGIVIPFTTAAVVVAQVFVAAPFFIRSARTGLAGVPHDLEDAARVDGATEPQVFRHVTVPLAGRALAAGAVMAWARALGEFGATIMFAGNLEGRTRTLPLLVYGEFEAGDLDLSLAAATVLVLAAGGVLLAVRVLHWGRALEDAAS